MRVTVQELENVIAQLPPARSYRHAVINIAIHGETLATPRPRATPRHSDLRVVTFRIMKPTSNRHALPEWELVLA